VKYSTSGQRMTWFLGKFQLPNGGLSPTCHKLRTFLSKDWLCSWQILLPSGRRKYYHLRKRNPQLPERECHSAWVNFNFWPENWALPSRSSGHSSRQTQFKAGRNYHVAAGRAKYTWIGEILNFPFREYAIYLPARPISSNKQKFGTFYSK